MVTNPRAVPTRRALATAADPSLAHAEVLLQEVDRSGRCSAADPLVRCNKLTRDAELVHPFLEHFSKQLVVNPDAHVGDFGVHRTVVNEKDRWIVLGQMVDRRDLLKQPV